MRTAYISIDPATLVRAGFRIYDTGGGCMAFMRELPDGCQVLVTDCDGGLDYDSANWCVALYDANGDEVQMHWQHAGNGEQGEFLFDKSLAACIDPACANLLVDALTQEFDAYLTAHNLTPMSADELLSSLTAKARKKHGPFLSDFIERWDATMKIIYGN